MNKRLRSKIWSVTLTALFSTFIYIPQASATACSPTTTTYGSYTVLSFTTSGTCTWTAPSDISTADILLIGGGGGGGGGAFGGGGGAGGFVEKLNHSITANSSYSIVVGAGGNGGAATLTNANYPGGNFGIDGQDSTFDSLTAKGGGGGAGFLGAGGSRTNAQGRSGGSGGGASEGGGAASGGSSTQSSFTGATTYGNAGGASVAADSKSGGGGGGAGGAGGASEVSTRYRGGTGGSGATSTLRTGSSVTYSEGGTGGSDSFGGDGNRSAETANTGNGGDGANWYSTSPNLGGAGGSGILVIRYVANVSSSDSSSPQIWLGKYSIDCPLPNPSEKELIQTANKITPVTASSENLVGKNISQETLDLVGQNEIYFDFWSNKVKTATIELPTYGCSDKLVRVKQNSSVQFIAGGFNLQSEARGYLQTPDGTWFDLTGVTLTKNTAAFLHTIKFVQPGKYLIVLSEQPDVDQHKIPTYGYKNARFVLEVSKKKSTLSASSKPAKTSNAQSIALENLETVAQVSPWQEKNSNPIYLYLLIITLFSFLYFVNKKPALSNYQEINIEDKFANFIEEMYSNIKN